MHKELHIENVTFDMFIEAIRPILTEIVATAIRNHSEEKLLSVEEACKIFQPAVSKGTIYNYEKEGHFSHRSLGGSSKRWYALSDILAASKNITRYSPSKSKLKVA